jgi:hypothetical protein
VRAHGPGGARRGLSSTVIQLRPDCEGTFRDRRAVVNRLQLRSTFDPVERTSRP